MQHDRDKRRHVYSHNLSKQRSLCRTIWRGFLNVLLLVPSVVRVVSLARSVPSVSITMPTLHYQRGIAFLCIKHEGVTAHLESNQFGQVYSMKRSQYAHPRTQHAYSSSSLHFQLEVFSAWEYLLLNRFPHTQPFNSNTPALKQPSPIDNSSRSGTPAISNTLN